MPASEYNYEQHNTENVKRRYPELYPKEGDSQATIDGLARKRQDVFEPASGRMSGFKDKRIVTFFNNRAAKDREAAGIKGEDKAYEVGEKRYYDSTTRR